MFALLGMEAMMVGAGMGMMMGGRMRGRGYCDPGCMDSCCTRVIICQPGCNGPCCANRVVVCPPGCNMPCCASQRGYMPNTMVPYNNPNQDPYMPNQFFPRYAPNNNLNTQQAQIDAEKRRQDDMAQKLRIQKQELLLKEQQQLLEMKRIQQQRQQRKLAEQKAQLLVNQKRLDQQKLSITKPNLNNLNRVNTYAEGSPYQKEQQVLFQGDIYQKYGNQWRHVNGALLTAQSFANIQIQNIIKIKYKAESEVKDTRILKISTRTGDYFFSVYTHQQADWMLKLIWAKLTSMGVLCKISEPYHGHIQGQIVKKGFFGGWETKYGNISGQMFSISHQMGTKPQKNIHDVPQIWTRFQLISGSLLVVKMHHSGMKIQLGIPIDHALAWLRGLVGLVKS